MKKILIIGAGIGGLSSAIRLLSKGYEVEIIEKENTVGGKINQINEDGYMFDLTATVIMTPKIYQELFSYANRDYTKYIEMIRLDPIYRVNYYDGSSYDFYSNTNKNIDTLESIEKGSSIDYLKYIAKSNEKYQISNEKILEKPMINLSEMMNYKTIKDLLKVNISTNSYKYLSKYINNEKILDYILFQTMYIGINPFEESNVYTLIPAISEVYGLWYIKGGMYSYIKALEKLVYELGGKIQTSTSAQDILTKDGAIKGVKYNNTNHYSDIVICNADFPYAMKELIKNREDKGKYSDTKLEKYKYSCSTFIIYLALDKKYNNLKTHNIYIGENFRENIESTFKGKIPKSPSLYIYCPSRIDGSMANNCSETINIMFRVPNLSYENILWSDKDIKETRKKIIESIKNIKGCEDIEKHIIFETYLTPKDLEVKYNAYKGTAFGLAHTLGQVGYLRPHIKSENVEGLYFIGSSTHPGNGVSVIINGSKLIVDEIIKQK